MGYTIISLGILSEGDDSIMSGRFRYLLLLFSAGWLLSSCSSINPNTSPEIFSPGLSSQHYLTDLTRELIGFWEVRVDSSGITTTEISDRISSKHFNVKAFLKPPKCYDCLKFTNVIDNTTTKVLSADVTIKNPTALSGADVRGIVMSNDPVVYLQNPDDYTTLFDPDNPPDINPFRLFGKDLPNGIIGPGVSASEHFEIKYDVKPFYFITAIDAVYKASANREPYAIKNQTISGVLDINGMVSRMIDVEVYDRHDNVGLVSIVSTELGIDMNLYENPSKPNSYFTYISNVNKAPAGKYKVLISAFDKEAPWVLYDYLTITISETVGSWSVKSFPFTGNSCSRDIAAGITMDTGEAYAYFPGGTGCDRIMKSSLDFSNPKDYFSLLNIDPLTPGFSPYPPSRIDTSFTGGMAFCSSSEAIYSDPFYTGPISSLMITIYPSASGIPKYINPGDGDCGRMYPSNKALRVIDVTDDMSGSLYGLWADPNGTLPPEIYGLYPDYTRHDVFMGGSLPSNLVGNGPGKVSPVASRLLAFDVTNYGMDSGAIYILESDGTNSEVEVLQYTVDFIKKVTVYSSLATINLSSITAVDLDIAMYNPLYISNPDGDSLAVLIKSPSGGYIRMYNTVKYTLIDEIGSAASPSISGVPKSIDFDSSLWQFLVLNTTNKAFVISWVI